MCGLFCVISTAPIDRRAMAEGVAALAHRGPDGEGLHLESLTAGGRQVHLAFGHRRLAVIDLDPRSDQPFRRGDHVLCYNGEIYNYRAIAAGLRGHGRPCEATGDTDLLLALLAARGLRGLEAANGMWAFCWLDRGRRRLIACRDRYGKKPLFYRVTPDGFAFASELKALKAISHGALRPRREAFDRFVASGWLFPGANGETHVAGVREVPPGGAVEIDLDTLAVEVLTQIPFPAPGDATDGESLAAALEEAVSSRLVSDRPVGLLLSGGVDSSLILSILASMGALDRVTAFIGDAGKSDDGRYALQAAEQLGVRRVVIPLDYSRTGFEDFLAVCRSQEKPFPLIGNALGLAALYRVIARHDAPVVLDGAGADEIFGGYWERYAVFAMRDAARRGDRAWLDRLRAGGQLPPAIADLGDDALVAGRIGPPKLPLLEGDRQWLRREAAARLAATPSGDPLDGFGGSLDDAMRIDGRSGRMQEWLWQNDRNAMAAGIENRSPFLDHRLARFVATGYAEKFGGPWNKRELRAAFRSFTPLPTADRAAKQGFRWVYGRFLRNNRDRLCDLLRGSSLAAAYADTTRLIDAGRRDDALFESRLFTRLIVLAGLETTGILESAWSPASPVRAAR